MSRGLGIIITVILLSGLFCRDGIIENYTLLSPANFLSNFGVYDSDWDARDASNRVISSTVEKEALRSLFISDIVIILDKEICSIARAMEILQVKFGLLKEFLCTPIYVFTAEIIAAIISKFKTLSIPFLFLIFLIRIRVSSLPELAYLFFLPKAKVAPLVLRC